MTVQPTNLPVAWSPDVGDLILVCPTCTEYCSHIRCVYTRIGPETATWQDSRDAYAGTEARVDPEFRYRRPGLVIVVDGECGHSWEVVIQQHKGVNSVLQAPVLAPDAWPVMDETA